MAVLSAAAAWLEPGMKREYRIVIWMVECLSSLAYRIIRKLIGFANGAHVESIQDDTRTAAFSQP